MAYREIDLLPERAFRKSCGRLATLEGGGGKGSSPPAPDYTPMANASERAAELGYQLGKEQLAESRRQYDINMGVATPIINREAALMEQQLQQGADYYNYSQSTFRPIEQELAEEARTGVSRYDTNPAVRAAVEQEASRAAADVAAATASANTQRERALLAMGVNPNSGRFAALKVGEGLATAAASAGAQTTARQRAVALDTAKRLDVVGLGRNLPGASQGAYTLALNAGNSAVTNQVMPSQGFMNGMDASNRTIMQGQALKLQGLGSVLGAQANAYAAGFNQDSGWGGVGALLGAAAATYGAFGSDRRLKKNIRLVGKDKRTGLNIYQFSYIDGDGVYRGVMADEVEAVRPDAVITDKNGYQRVDYHKLGIPFRVVSPATR